MAWLYTVPWIQQKQPVEFDGLGRVSNAKHPWLSYTQSWIQQKQLVEFDGFGTVANDKHPWLGYTQSHESNKSSRWSLMDLVEYQMLSIHGLAIHSPESNKKAAGGVWWIWYTLLHVHVLIARLYCGVLNPSKSAKSRRRILEDLGGKNDMYIFL